jgi:hypothetical protein
MPNIKTVKELINFLQSLEPETKIAIASGGFYYSGIEAKLRQLKICNKSNNAMLETDSADSEQFLILE